MPIAVIIIVFFSFGVKTFYVCLANLRNEQCFTMFSDCHCFFFGFFLLVFGDGWAVRHGCYGLLYVTLFHYKTRLDFNFFFSGSDSVCTVTGISSTSRLCARCAFPTMSCIEQNVSDTAFMLCWETLWLVYFNVAAFK